MAGYRMIYIKSVLVGIVLVLAVTIAYLIAAPFILLLLYPPPPHTEVGFDVHALLARPLFLLIALASFALGFYWEFRRLSS
jgi:hypothetical protein